MKCIYNFLKMCNLCHHKFIFANTIFNFKTSSLVSYFWKMSKFRWKHCNLCTNYHLYLPMSRCCLEVVGISKHLVWCHIFGKCQNLGGSDEMYYAATIQFSKNVQFVHCNHHNFIFANE